MLQSTENFGISFVTLRKQYKFTSIQKIMVNIHFKGDLFRFILHFYEKKSLHYIAEIFVSPSAN